MREMTMDPNYVRIRVRDEHVQDTELVVFPASDKTVQYALALHVLSLVWALDRPSPYYRLYLDPLTEADQPVKAYEFSPEVKLVHPRLRLPRSIQWSIRLPCAPDRWIPLPPLFTVAQYLHHTTEIVFWFVRQNGQASAEFGQIQE